jgi:hypothetical protein
MGAFVDSVESLEAFARDHGPGRYDVDEHSLDVFPSSNRAACLGPIDAFPLIGNRRA